MAIKHILVPYDLSAQSDRAFDTALDLAIKNGGKLSVVTVLAPNLYSSWGSTWKELRVLSKLKDLDEKAKKSGVTFWFEIIWVKKVTDTFAIKIVSYAKEYNVDLIVMGTRALKGFKKKISGSVSEGVEKFANCEIIKVK